MKLAVLTSAAALLLTIGACTASAPAASGLADTDRPEPVRPTQSATVQAPLTGMALAVTGGATELFVVDMGRAELTHPAGSLGDAEADTAATLAHVRSIVAGLQLWAEDGAVIIDGPPPFTGRARSLARGGVLRIALTPRPGAGSAERTVAAEVRGDEIVGRAPPPARRGPGRTARSFARRCDPCRGRSGRRARHAACPPRPSRAAA
jgi:hypothetical protein